MGGKLSKCSCASPQEPTIPSPRIPEIKSPEPAPTYPDKHSSLITLNEYYTAVTSSPDYKQSPITHAIAPDDNFFLSLTNFLANSPVANEPTNNTLDQLNLSNKAKIHEIIASSTPLPEEKIIAGFISSGMNFAEREKAGMDPLTPFLEMIEKVKHVDDVVHLNAVFRKNGLGKQLFGIDAIVDPTDNSSIICRIFRDGLGLPDAEYYSDPVKATIRGQFVAHISRLLQICDPNINNPNLKALGIFNIEKELALSSSDQSLTRKTFEEITVLTPNINWNCFFSCLGLKDFLGDDVFFIIENPKFLLKINEMFEDGKKYNIEQWKLYLKWNLLSASSIFLSKELADEHFDFNERILNGTLEQNQRFEEFIIQRFPKVLEKLYVAKHCNNKKAEVLEITDFIFKALKKRVSDETIPWMNNQFLDKLETLPIKIAYPNKWIDISELETGISSSKHYFDNFTIISNFDFESKITKRVNIPVDVNSWNIPCFDVNAYLEQSVNELVIPAAILELPFYYSQETESDATKRNVKNFGSMGVLIAYEIINSLKGEKDARFQNVSLNDKDDAFCVLLAYEAMEMCLDRRCDDLQEDFFSSFAALWNTLNKE